MSRITPQSYRQIYEFLEETSLNEFHDAIAERVLGQPELKLLTANIYSYLFALAHDAPAPLNKNVLLAGESGSGKTEVFRALFDYFSSKIPLLTVASSDITNITSTGFKGNNPDSMLEPFIRNGSCGILFIDEFDKILTPSISGHGENVHLTLQHNLLTLIEGSKQLVNGHFFCRYQQYPLYRFRSFF